MRKAIYSVVVIAVMAAASQAAASEWRQVGKVADLQIVVVQKNFAGQKNVFEKAARDACGRQDFCRVALWLEGAEVPKGFPMTDKQLNSQMGSYTRNTRMRTDRMQWKCGAFEGLDRSACF